MGGGGSDSSVEYSQSPEQRAVYEMLKPLVQRLGYSITGEPARKAGTKMEKEWVKPVPGHYEYVDTNREGDHICYISDLSKMKEHYPQREITKSLDDIFTESVKAWTNAR